MFNKSGTGNVAFDAASSGSFAWLNAQLELASPQLVKPLSSMTHPRDITVKFGGGFPDYLTAYATDFGTTGGNQYGLQDTNNTDIPEVQVNVTKGVWQTWLWAQGFTITVLDLKKLETASNSGQPAPFSLQSLLEEGIQEVWNKAMEVVTYNGWLGQPGLLNNNAGVNSSLAPATGTGSSRLWSTKTPLQIQSDVNFALAQAISQAVYANAAYPDSCLIDYNAFNTLFQPFVLGTVGGYASVGAYIEANNIAKASGVDFKFKPVANPWISTQGAGGTGRACFYRNDEKNVKLHAPQPAQKVFTIPTTDKGGAYVTLFNGCIGQVQFLRNQSFYYLDGIS
jgi:hypothetical protein